MQAAVQRPRAAQRRLQRARGWAAGPGWAFTWAFLAGCTGLSLALERVLDPPSLVMVFLCGVACVAYRCDRIHAVAMIAGSILVYDLIFVEPRWSLKPAEPRYWLAFAVMLAVGLVISHLAARLREQALLANARARRSIDLNLFVSTLNSARDAHTVLQALGEAVRSSLGLQAQVVPVADFAGAGVGSRVQGDPAPGEVALQVGNEVVAVLRVEPTRWVSLPPEDRQQVQAMCSQAALAVERARFEQRSTEAAVEAERERIRSTLLAGVSHDFRTPLTTIMGCATTLLEQAHAIDEPQRRAMIGDLLSQAQRLHRLSSNLLDLSRLDEGAIPLQPEWCPAEDLLEEALCAFRSAPAAHRLVTHIGVEDVVWCDPQLMQQVIVNLVENAIRHSPPDEPVEIAIELQAQRWRLTVADRGPGVTPGDELAVFRKFYQSARDGESSGKGLGLAICAAVVKLHGGTIEVTRGLGARFTVELPQPAMPQLEGGELA